MPEINYESLPFDEAIEFLRQKTLLPTRTWKDIWQGMHSRAFTVAGAMKKDLLQDLYDSIDKALTEGTTLNDFRKDFRSIVQKHGWAYKGGERWRSAIIYDTNLGVAYSAGHYKQMMHPDILKVRPYFRYVPSSSANPREEHKQWYNLVLPADDPFWKTHYPPNAWRCKCGVVSVSKRELERLKGEESEGLYPVRTEAPEIKTYRWVDKDTGKVHMIPEGIDPGWAYNPGAAANGKPLPKGEIRWQA